MIINTFLSRNQKLVLPELSDKLGLASPDFTVVDIFQGGMGTCAKIQSTNGQFFALKILHTSLQSNNFATQRYIEEMKTWLTLSACNGVVEAFCLTKLNDIPCIVAKWMDNGSLRSYMGHSTPGLFYNSIDRIASTLDWAFSKYAIIHRDLKPENILIDTMGNAFVADWGLARPITLPSNESNFESVLNKHSGRIDITEVGSFLGTILYASPEQILGLKNIDHRSDIYSLGCIMYEWETGAAPFLADTPLEIAVQHLHKRPNRIGGLFKTTNFKVEKIIEKCLEKNPNKRFQSYTEFLKAFNELAIKNPTYNKFKVKERYKVPLIGNDEFVHKLKGENFNAVYSQDGEFALIELDEIEPYLLEAEALIILGEYGKARSILEQFYLQDLFEKMQDSFFVQSICVNYAITLRYLGENEKAIFVLRTIGRANFKLATYYVNLSLLYLMKRDYPLAEEICKTGLEIYPDDIDLMGNLTISLSNLDKLNEALEVSLKQISISRNVNSLEEIAHVYNKMADGQKNLEFPSAISNYKTALSYLQEVKKLNPDFETARLSIANLLYKLKKYSDSTNEALHICNTTKVRTIAEIGIFYIARNLLWTAKFAEGRDFCKKWLNVYPDSIFLNRVLSEILVDGYVIDNYRDGVRVVEKSSLEFFTSIVNDEQHRLPSDFNYLAKIYAWMGGAKNLNNSTSILEQGLELYPEYWKLNFTLSAIYLRTNYLDEALEEALEAKNKAPWRESIYSLLSSIYAAKGDIDGAKKYEEEGEKLKFQKQQLYQQI